MCVAELPNQPEPLGSSFKRLYNMDHRYSYSQDNDDGYGGQVVYGEQEDVGQYADDQSQDDMDVVSVCLLSN